jgi:haloalkane dehalogenase
MDVLRTPEERFEKLPGYPFEPNFVEVDGIDIHFIDEGPPGADPVLLLHGEPSWSFLYRHMIPPIAAGGLRAVAPHLVGFGRSDKPTRIEDHTYARHVAWMTEFLDELDLQRITLVCQDWGGLIGLRLVADQPARFARVVAANTGLPTGDGTPGEAFLAWREFVRTTPELPVGRILSGGTTSNLPAEVVAAYEAPFPDESYQAGARALPLLVPISPDDPAAEANRRAWEVLRRFDRPFLTAFSDSDAITRGGEAVFRSEVPGARNQAHTAVEGAGHFLQEDRGPELARIVLDFIARG